MRSPALQTTKLIMETSSRVKSPSSTSQSTDNQLPLDATAAVASVAENPSDNSTQPPKTISKKEDEKSLSISKPMPDQHARSDNHNDSSIKLKRCKHGRIIIKDLSKKKLNQVVKARPLSDASSSSDLYDPESPIMPLTPEEDVPPHDVPPDDVPSSAVQLNRQEKYLQKLNRQERVIEEVKVALRPFYQDRSISKEQYKDVLRRAVPKICHSKNGEINPIKIRALVEAYVKKMKHH